MKLKTYLQNKYNIYVIMYIPQKKKLQITFIIKVEF